VKLKLVFLYFFRVRVKIVIYYGSKPVVYPTGGGGGSRTAGLQVSQNRNLESTGFANTMVSKDYAIYLSVEISCSLRYYKFENKK